VNIKWVVVGLFVVTIALRAETALLQGLIVVLKREAVVLVLKRKAVVLFGISVDKSNHRWVKVIYVIGQATAADGITPGITNTTLSHAGRTAAALVAACSGLE
jgi:hypothetical protein